MTWNSNAGLVNAPDSMKKLNENLESLLGITGSPPCILSGLSVTPGTGLVANLAAGKAIIAESLVTQAGSASVNLLKRRAQLLYKDKNNANGVVSCQYPAYNDANTVVRYDMNHLNGQWIENTYYPLNATVSANSTYYKVTTAGISGTTEPTWPVSGTVTDGSTLVWTQQAGAGTIVPNSASAGVANDLSITGTVSQVDGRRGYARKGDGSTGNVNSANYTGFPTGASVRELSVLYTVNLIATRQFIVQYGNSNLFHLEQTAANTIGISSGTGVTDSLYTVELGKTYWILANYNGTTIRLYINGTLIFTSTVALNTGTLCPLRLFAIDGTSLFANCTIHYVELRNALRTPAQIVDVAQKMLIPCSSNQPLTFQSSATLISGGDTSPYVVSRLVDGVIGSDGGVWASSQSNTAVSGAAYFGQSGITQPLKKISFYTYNNANNNLSSVKVQYSNDGSNWIDIQTFTIPTTASIKIDLDLMYYPGNSNHRVRVLANANPATSTTWIVYEAEFISAPTPTDIRSSLPNLTDYSVVSYLETSATAPTLIIDGSNPSGSTPDYAYGIRVGPRGCRNKKKFLGWQYFSGSVERYWANPFGIRKLKPYFTISTDSLGTNESDISQLFYSGVNAYGCYPGGETSARRIEISTQNFGAGVINAAWLTSGYIGCYCEILDEESV